MQIKEINATKLPDIGIKRVAAYARVSSEKRRSTTFFISTNQLL